MLRGSKCVWWCYAAQTHTRKLKRRLCTVDAEWWFNQSNQQEPDLARQAFISSFKAQYPNPLALSTASDWMQREWIVKPKKLYAKRWQACEEWVRQLPPGQMREAERRRRFIGSKARRPWTCVCCDGWGYCLCVFCSSDHAFGTGATLQLWRPTLVCQLMQK